MKRVLALIVLVLLGFTVDALLRSSHAPTADAVFEKVRLFDRDAIAEYVRAEPGIVGWRDPLGYTPLHWATAVNDLAMARLLLTAGANPNARDNRGRTPLHHAAISLIHGDGGAVLAKSLAEFGADVNATDADGLPPLRYASRTDNSDLAQALLAAGAAPSAAEPQAAPTRVSRPVRTRFERRFALRQWRAFHHKRCGPVEMASPRRRA